MENCFICGKSLDENNTILVKKRRIQTLLKASIIRQEKEHELMLKGLETLRVHDACQIHYGDERKAQAARKRLSQSSLPSTSSQSPPVLSSSSLPQPSEDLIEHLRNKCFICYKEITEEWLARNKKKKIKNRERIHSVWNVSRVKDTIFNCLDDRNDEFAKSVIRRISDIPDDVKDVLKYHGQCMQMVRKPLPKGIRKGLKCERLEELTASIINFMSGREECQFKLSEILEELNYENVPDWRTIKKSLLAKCGEDVIITDCRGHDAFILYKHTGYTALLGNWYQQKKHNAKEERDRVINEAATIVLEDIRGMLYENEKYPPSDEFLMNIESEIPGTLKLFLNTIILKMKTGTTEKWQRICTTIAHCIIAAARSRKLTPDVDIDHGNEYLVNALKLIQTPMEEIDSDPEHLEECSDVEEGPSTSEKRRRLL